MFSAASNRRCSWRECLSLFRYHKKAKQIKTKQTKIKQIIQLQYLITTFFS